ncbi:MAG: acetyl-CoA carboxylase biotin carboxyl carrier protein [Clostridia bacterium]|nr:acetyl-CoA carboxylase biotin carboxyl carrier protein [Clostridia bacterium]
MKESTIRKYAGLMAEFGLTGLEITEENTVIRLERAASAAPAVPAVQVLPQAAPAAEAVPAPQISDTAVIRSPMVGVFYAAPAEDREPFVHTGDTVKKGDVLCIIESMKLMNEITAEQDGVISEICVKNGQVVDYGAELFRLKKV